MSFFRIIYTCARHAVRPALKTAFWLLRIMLPISLIVTLMQHYGIISWLAQYLHPLFQHIGLPGASAIAFLTAASVTTYAGLAVMLSMTLTMRQATILAVMALICHALPLESAVVKKVGSNPWKMAVIRIVAAFLAALWLNWVLPPMSEAYVAHPVSEAALPLIPLLLQWCEDSMRMSVMICLILLGLMFLQRLMDDYGIMYRLVRPLRPLMRFFGLPDNSAYLWLVGNVLGISYGSAMMLSLEECGQITRQEADEVNYHLIMSHSMLEDTMVFASTGIPALWILSTRLLFALALVWGRKLLRRIISA